MQAAARQSCVHADGEAFVAASQLLFGPIRQVFAGEAPLAAPMLTSVDLSACQLTRIRAPSHAVVANSDMRQSFDPDSVKILMQLSGRSRFAQQENSVDLGPRSAVIYDPVRNYSMMNLSRVDQLILQVPRTTCGDRALARLARPILLPSEENGLMRIIYSLTQMAITEAERLDDADCRRVGDSVIRLVQGLVSTGEAGDLERLAPLEVLKERIVEFIDAHIGDGELSLDLIARRMGCSRRYLHRAFEDGEVTPERYIWERRLAVSHEALSTPEAEDRSISEIAFACGFNSSAHFSRAFKGRYGVTPRALREHMRRNAAQTRSNG